MHMHCMPPGQQLTHVYTFAAACCTQHARACSGLKGVAVVQCSSSACSTHSTAGLPATPGMPTLRLVQLPTNLSQLGAPAIPDTKGCRDVPAHSPPPAQISAHRPAAPVLCSPTASSRQPYPLEADSQQRSRQPSRMDIARSTNRAATAAPLLLLCLTLAATAARPAVAQDNIWQALQSLPGLTNFTRLIQGVPSLYNLTQDDNGSQTFFAPTDEVRLEGKALHE